MARGSRDDSGAGEKADSVASALSAGRRRISARGIVFEDEFGFGLRVGEIALRLHAGPRSRKRGAAPDDATSAGFSGAIGKTVRVEGRQIGGALVDAVAATQGAAVDTKAEMSGPPALLRAFRGLDFRGRAPEDLHAAKSELSARFLTSDSAMAASRLIPGIAPTPEVNVVGVGVGEKISGGARTGEVCVKLLLRRKYPRDRLRESEVLPKAIDGVAVDVEEIGLLRPLSGGPDPRSQLTPAVPGCSIGFAYPGDAERMAGTFGARVIGPDGKRYILSNSHVLANLGALPIGSPIFQAGLADLARGAATRQIARLSAFAPMTGAAPVDAAIAEPLSPELIGSEILQIGAPKGREKAEIDMIVHKFGRTTGYTAGRVTNVSLDISIQYENGAYVFANQIAVEGLDGAFSEDGDSGSLVLDRASGAAVGLLFAGASSMSVANPIDEVCASLGVELG